MKKKLVLLSFISLTFLIICRFTHYTFLSSTSSEEEAPATAMVPAQGGEGGRGGRNKGVGNKTRVGVPNVGIKRRSNELRFLGGQVEHFI
jgi:hypothetical protein